MNKKSKSIKKRGVSMRFTLIMFALLPMLLATVIVAATIIGKASNELNKITSNSMVSIIKGTGNSFDFATHTAEQNLMGFAQAPVIIEALQHPEDASLAAKANKYTNDYFSKLSGWEGLYLADWNTKVLTHESDAIIGKVLREGDSLTALRDSMLNAGGVYNTGIITSPASGKLVQSIYYPVVVNGQPIGFVGGAVFFNDIASQISDVT